MKKYVVGLVILFLIGCGAGIVISGNQKQSFTKGSTVTAANYCENITCNKNYKSITFSLHLDNTSSNEEVNVKIINPDGDIVEEKKVSENDSLDYKKNLEGIKGDYKIEINKNDDINSYSYNIDFQGEN